jgi:triosephosphate isomerase
MSRKKIAAGNWKMNKNLFEGKQLIAEILSHNLSCPEACQVIIAPPFTQLELAATQLKDKEGYFLAAQNCHQEKSGAYTGEVSAEMLKSVGVSHVIIGHSERREYFGENAQMLAQKVNRVLEQGMNVIFCVGEHLNIREENKQNEFVRHQVSASLFHLEKDDFKKIIIAYEPIWAIGTGKTATKEQAQEMHAFIRATLAEKYGDEAANETSILYGGSCKPDNAKELFSEPDVDGGLIGGASLNADDFIAIVETL